MKIIKFFVLLLCLSSFAGYAAESPRQMLETTAQQMLEKLKTHKEAKHDIDFIQTTVREILVPRFDLETMAKMVVGGKDWKKSTPVQHKQFINEFTTLLIGTYSTALSSYDDQKIVFYPIRGSIEDQVQVDSKILRREGPAIPVSYRLKRINKDWKVYDFSVDGVSMVESFRAQFSTELAQGGMTQLLAKLSAHNKQGKN